ncbi:MAG: hypothetical protein AABM40_03150 [Chloroflexota bacterium]
MFRFIPGVDSPEAIASLNSADLGELHDPVARLVLGRGIFPRSAAEFLTAIAAHDQAADGLPSQRTFLAGEGAQIANLKVDRQLRFVITRGRREGEQPDVLISTSATGSPFDGFLQVIGWDDKRRLYNFYQRLFGNAWFWSGNSEHALRSPSRGRGPFDSHVNGTLVMKELKQPWLNWHSMNASIHQDLLRESTLSGSLFAQELSGAEDLEQQVMRPGVRRSTAARVARSCDGVTVREAPLLLRHLFDSTTVNLASTTLQSTRIQATTDVMLPLSFFLASDLLLNGGLGLESAVTGARKTSGKAYLSSLAQFEVALKAPGFHQSGDTFFAFVVPERSLEDDEVVREMLRLGWLTPRFVACALMVDLANPVFSNLRAELTQVVPDELALAQDGGFSETLANLIVAKATKSGVSGAAEFASLWNLGTEAWRDAAVQRISSYVAAVDRRLTTEDGFADYFRLAESRRREFARTPLREFCLTLPATNIPDDAALLEMNENGDVQPKRGQGATGGRDAPKCV